MASAVYMSTPVVRRSPSPISIGAQRLSSHSAVSSSAASFQTAPLTASSSMQPTPRDSNPVNPLHTLSKRASQEQEIHILKVTDDTVRLANGPVQEAFFTRIMTSHTHTGALPPSPPASIENDLSAYGEREREQDSVTVEEPEPEPEPVPRLTRSSTETKASMKTILAPTPPTPPPPASVHSKSISHMSADGFLQPPALTIHRPARRNTTGSTPKIVAPVPDELESDIQLHAENIRRERMSKRAKQQQEAEAALTREKEKDSTPDVVLVGNLIGEDHVNYVLMYNMLTGIRIGVCSSLFLHSNFFHCFYPGLAVPSQDQTTTDGRRLHGAAQILIRYRRQ